MVGGLVEDKIEGLTQHHARDDKKGEMIILVKNYSENEMDADNLFFFLVVSVKH